MPDITDDNAGVTPGDTPAAQAPTVTQTVATPAASAPPSVRGPSALRAHWALIAGSIAVALFLLLGGMAIGAVIAGHGDWGGHHRFGDGRAQGGRDGQGGQMMGPGGQMMGPGGYGGQGNGACPQAGSGYAPGYRQPDGQPNPGSSPAPDTAPSQPATP